MLWVGWCFVEEGPDTCTHAAASPEGLSSYLFNRRLTYIARILQQHTFFPLCATFFESKLSETKNMVSFVRSFDLSFTISS